MPHRPPRTASHRLSSLRLAVRRGVLRRRRSLAALCAVIAVGAGLRATQPPEPPTVALSVAAHDLPAGRTLTGADLTELRVPPAAVPDGAGDRSGLLGRSLAAPVRRGEPITDRRLVDDSLTAGYPGRAVVPVRLPDAAAAGLLRPGDHVSIWAAGSRGDSAALAVGDALVVTVGAVEEEAGPAALPGRLVLLAVPPADLGPLLAAAAREWLSYAYLH